MQHLSESEMVELEMGITTANPAVTEHLGACAQCQAELAAWSATLTGMKQTATPERDGGYGARVWQRLEPTLDGPPRRAWLVMIPARWLPAAAMAMLALVVAGAFWLGRWSKPAPAPPALAAATAPAPANRQQVLLLVVGDHLDRAQMVLLQVEHADVGAGGVNLAPEQQWARELVASGRLYQQTAAQTGAGNVAAVLDALEPVLLQIANSPARPSGTQLRQLQAQIHDAGVLFKVRVLDATVRDQRAGVKAGKS